MTKKQAAELASTFEESLARQSTPGRADYEKKYLKSQLRFLGAATPAVRSECNQFYKNTPLEY